MAGRVDEMKENGARLVLPDPVELVADCKGCGDEEKITDLNDEMECLSCSLKGIQIQVDS